MVNNWKASTERVCWNEENKPKETLRTYDNKGKEKNSSTSEKKEKSRDGNISISECGENFCHSTYEGACTSTYSIKDISMIMMEEFFWITNSTLNTL